MSLLFQFALPRGERRSASSCASRATGFNSRSREGSDPNCPACRRAATRFNSRSREGSDVRHLQKFRGRPVSIRAPARGATSSICFLTSSSLGFNSRSREGSDVGATAGLAAVSSFNSRSREGSDAQPQRQHRRREVSIRAPARGATYTLPITAGHARVSIRAPARGATSTWTMLPPIWKVSIRAPARGATMPPPIFEAASCVSIRAPARGATLINIGFFGVRRFQFALPRGERRPRRHHPRLRRSFNSRSREGSDF